MGCLDTVPFSITSSLRILNITPNSGVVPQTLKTLGSLAEASDQQATSVVWSRLTSDGIDFLHPLKMEDCDQYMCCVSIVTCVWISNHFLEAQTTVENCRAWFSHWPLCSFRYHHSAGIRNYFKLPP